jgi:hypothetical protein
LAAAGGGILDTLFGKSPAGSGLISSKGIVDFFKNTDFGGGGSGGGIAYDANGAVINSTVPSDYETTTGADAGYSAGV